MDVLAVFIGEDKSMGFRTGRIYDLEIINNTIVSPVHCPYSSIEAFIRNWSSVVIKPGEG